MPTRKNWNKKLGVAAAVACIALTAQVTHAFVFVAGAKAPVDRQLLTFKLDIPGLSESGLAWNDAFDEAARDWSMTTAIQINTDREAVNPCESAAGGLAVGYVGVSESLCGQAAHSESGASAYASVTSLNGRITHGNIIYNTDSGVIWDIYDGTIKSQLQPYLTESGMPHYEPIRDFRRVSLHELGHVLGLGHSVFPRSMLSAGSDRARDTDTLSPDDICGVNIANGRLDGCSLLLQSPSTMTGKSTTAVFVGGASRDRGATYETVFQSNESIDVMATVVVEDQHFEQQGRLHTVVELSDGTILMATDDGFAPWDGTVQALKTTAVRSLSGANELYILKDFNLAANLISNISVAIYVGYSLDSEPGEVYFSGAPIQFRVE